MRLTELNPNWASHGGDDVFRKNDAGELEPIPERTRIGLCYDCPCGCGDRRYVPFCNPEDGQGPASGEDKVCWQRSGTTFEELTLTPSIQHVPVEDGDCAWHGFITAGEVRTV